MKVKDSFAGKKGRCPFCSSEISVPTATNEDVGNEPSIEQEKPSLKDVTAPGSVGSLDSDKPADPLKQTSDKLPHKSFESEPDFPTWFEERKRAMLECKERTPMVFWGRLLLIVGGCLAGFFLFIYDTTVSSGYGEVHNLGLQQNRTLGSVAGMIMAAVGAILLALDKRPPNERSSDPNLTPKNEENQDH
jgi:hypothetical protein